MFYVLPEIYGHLMLNWWQHASKCWPCYQFRRHGSFCWASCMQSNVTKAERNSAYTWHLLQSPQVKVPHLNFNMFCILFVFFCSLVYAVGRRKHPRLDCSVVLLSCCPVLVFSCCSVVLLSCCPLHFGFDILHIRFILQLQYLICSYANCCRFPFCFMQISYQEGQSFNLKYWWTFWLSTKFILNWPFK